MGGANFFYDFRGAGWGGCSRVGHRQGPTYVIPAEVMHWALRQLTPKIISTTLPILISQPLQKVSYHSIIFQLRLSQRRTVACNDNQLGFAGA